MCPNVEWPSSPALFSHKEGILVPRRSAKRRGHVLSSARKEHSVVLPPTVNTLSRSRKSAGISGPRKPSEFLITTISLSTRERRIFHRDAKFRVEPQRVAADSGGQRVKDAEAGLQQPQRDNQTCGEKGQIPDRSRPGCGHSWSIGRRSQGFLLSACSASSGIVSFQRAAGIVDGGLAPVDTREHPHLRR